VDDIDRLSSYLDGALEPDEQQALEAELAGDAALRSDLAALRRLDATLAESLAVELPPGARQRLDERLRPVVHQLVNEDVTLVAAAAPTTTEALDQRDDLAGRRARRRLPVAIGSVAAGLAILAAGVVGIDRFLGPMGGDDEAATMALDTVEEQAEQGEQAELAEAMPEADGALPDLPVVVDEGRRVSEQDLDLALAAPALQQLTAAALDGPEAAQLADEVQARLLGAPASAADSAESLDPPESAEEDAASGPALTTPDGRLLATTDANDLRRCLAELLEVGNAAIPVQVELLEVDRVPAIQIGLVTPDPQTGAYTRAEVWTLQRASCQVLRFAQS
jgi:anti-sigma factor RsiW